MLVLPTTPGSRPELDRKRKHFCDNVQIEISVDVTSLSYVMKRRRRDNEEVYDVLLPIESSTSKEEKILLDLLQDQPHTPSADTTASSTFAELRAPHNTSTYIMDLHATLSTSPLYNDTTCTTSPHQPHSSSPSIRENFWDLREDSDDDLASLENMIQRSGCEDENRRGWKPFGSFDSC